ncbi:peptide transporter [Palaeococcus pacificus DY20341]|uniref:Peptide transporter n=1 Tax=Palaeococcus pacificus DY20341 TaxID=1343739 RepID=A0A075LZJ0_9EURY|nr:M55 family metallopeptidase [Palaeococcus pacificus]AIF70008.1 peptide transporter [Palaeococcus pacificus DY20341]
MKAFISVDLEGMPFVVSREHLFVKGALYNEARKIATKITLAVVEELYENGFDEILIADSHGPMVNLLVDELPPYVELIRGFPRPVSMVAGVEEADAVLFLGYHSKAGTPSSTFDHTYSGATVDSLKINSVPVSEFLLNSYVAGHYNVPVILVAGDAKLIEDDVKKFAPWVEGIPLKRAFSRYSARSPSLAKLENELKDGVKRAVEKLKAGEARPLKTSSPVKVELRFLGSEMAETAELLPSVKRIDGKTVEFEARDVVEAYKVFELLVLASAGVRAVVMR